MQVFQQRARIASMLFVIAFNPGHAMPEIKQSLNQQPIPKSRTVDASQSERFPIILYHHIRPVTTSMPQLARDLSVTPEAFEAQLSYFKSRQYHSMPLRDFAAGLSEGKPIPQHSFALTFDDGYEDFYTHAWPLLRRYGFHATLFVIVNSIGTPDYVTWEQIKELDEGGLVDIESHTLNHPVLANLTPNKALYEIEQSKKILEQYLGHPISLFCYPYGSYTKNIADTVQQAGYSAGITTKGGVIHSKNSLFELPRARLSTADKGMALERKLNSFFGQKTP